MLTGDTLRSVTAKLWGDENLWYLIADANGLNGTEQLAAGETILVPARVTNAHQSSSTFRVYDPNKAVGDVQPTTPPPHQTHQVAHTSPSTTCKLQIIASGRCVSPTPRLRSPAHALTDRQPRLALRR